MIISFVNEKGGVGKTTLVTNVAACLSQRGYKVCLVDTDRQQASTVWYNNREKGDIFISSCTEPKALSKHLTQLIDQYDIVLVDGRPHIDEMLDRTMLASDVVIIPDAIVSQAHAWRSRPPGVLRGSLISTASR